MCCVQTSMMPLMMADVVAEAMGWRQAARGPGCSAKHFVSERRPGMTPSMSVRGGLRVGWLHASWPLARLTASERRLSVSTLLLGGYDFTPDQMIALEPHGNVPVIGRGIRLRHSRPDYPRRIVSWCAESPQQLLGRIQRGAGSVPRPPRATEPATPTGAPVRPRAIVVAIAAWLLLGLLGGLTPSMGAPPPGPFPFLLVG